MKLIALLSLFTIACTNSQACVELPFPSGSTAQTQSNCVSNSPTAAGVCCSCEIDPNQDGDVCVWVMDPQIGSSVDRICREVPCTTGFSPLNTTTEAPIPTTYTTPAPITTTDLPPLNTTEAPVSSTTKTLVSSTTETTQDPDDICCNCLTLDSEPGCADTACEEKLCDDYRMDKCCTSHWGPPCVHKAMDQCKNYKTCCGCLNEKRGGGCYDRECERMICNTDPFCCYNKWDDICVMKADAQCNDEQLPVCCDCAVQQRGKGCESDSICEESICDQDSFCCKYRWDRRCANKAAAKCRG